MRSFTAAVALASAGFAAAQSEPNVNFITYPACLSIFSLVEECVSANPSLASGPSSLYSSCLCSSNGAFQPERWGGPASQCVNFIESSLHTNGNQFVTFATDFCYGQAVPTVIPPGAAATSIGAATTTAGPAPTATPASPVSSAASGSGGSTATMTAGPAAGSGSGTASGAKVASTSSSGAGARLLPASGQGEWSILSLIGSLLAAVAMV